MVEYPYKTEFIERRGLAAYEKKLQRKRDWSAQHREEVKRSNQGFNKTEKKKEFNRELDRKGGKYYEKYRRIYNSTGIQGQRNLIRAKHRRSYTPFKQIIAPESQIHHEWVPETADYRGVALVEANQHMHGYIDVIQILEGEITLFTEAEVQDRGALV